MFNTQAFEGKEKKQKTKKLSMKKLVLIAAVSVFSLGMLSCGGGHGSCDAYRKSDYTTYKAEKTKKIEFEKFVAFKKSENKKK